MRSPQFPLRRRCRAGALLMLLVAAPPALAQGTITGRVTQRGTQAPVPGVLVVAIAEGRGPVDSMRTRADGGYRFAGLGSGRYHLDARLVGFAPVSTPTIDVDSSATADLPIELVSRTFVLTPISIITVGRMPESLARTAGSVSVRDATQVQERPAAAIADHLVGLPGVDVAATGLMQKNLVLRGFGNVFSGATLMLSDYRYSTVPSLRLNAGYLVPAVNEDVERIEVALGPSSALYGPNGANGLVHVITKSPFESRGTTVSLAGGDRSVVRAGGRHALVLGDRVGIKLSGQYLRGRDWRATDPVEEDNREQALASTTRPDTVRIGLRDDAVMRWTGEARVDVRPSEGSEIVVAAGTATAGRAIELTGLGAAQVDGWRYDYYQVRSRVGRLFAQAFMNTSDAGDTWILRTGLPIIDRSYTVAAQLQHGLDLGERQSFTYGLDAQRTTPRTDGTITGRNEGRDRIDEIGAYLQSQTRVAERVDLVTALRIDRHNHVEDHVVSPRAAVIFRPAEGHKLRVTYNRAFSTPTTNHLFLDIVAAPTLGGLPFALRAAGVPSSGFSFRRDCAGGVGSLCMRSPTALGAPDDYLPADATLLWGAVGQILYQKSQGQIDIRGVPAPSAAQVATVLRQLNATDGSFAPVEASAIRDIAPIRPTINNVVEIGYNGVVANRVSLSADVYYERKHDFIGPLVVETPNAFLEPASLAAYLVSVGYPATAAQAIATEATKIPVGTIAPESDLTDAADLVLTYRNFGEVDLWGANLGLEAYLTDRVVLDGSYSRVSDDFFPRSLLGGLSDIALNAPKHKGALGVRFRDDASALSLGARGRWAAGFPMNSGIYVGRVESSRQLDLSLAWALPRTRRQAMVSVEATNVLDERHRQFIGGPEIGRFVMTKVQYTF